MHEMKISVVTPSFNQSEFIEDTIKSVLNQGYKNLEYIVVDGGSTDGAVDIIKKYDDQLSYWVSEKDDGHADALNKGFSKSTGEIMAWLNSDDMYTPWAFKTVAEIFSQFPNVNWIVGFNSAWNDHGQMINAFRKPKNIYDYLLGQYRWIQQESVFWRRSLWEKAGGFVTSDYKFMIDGELWSRFFKHDEMYSVDCVLSGYRIHEENRASLNMGKCLAEMDQICEAMAGDVSVEYLRRVSKYKKIRILHKLPLLGWRLSMRFDRTLEEMAYKNIYYLSGKGWLVRTLPYG